MQQLSSALLYGLKEALGLPSEKQALWPLEWQVRVAVFSWNKRLWFVAVCVAVGVSALTHAGARESLSVQPFVLRDEIVLNLPRNIDATQYLAEAFVFEKGPGDIHAVLPRKLPVPEGVYQKCFHVKGLGAVSNLRQATGMQGRDASTLPTGVRRLLASTSAESNSSLEIAHNEVDAGLGFPGLFSATVKTATVEGRVVVRGVRVVDELQLDNELLVEDCVRNHIPSSVRRRGEDLPVFVVVGLLRGVRVNVETAQQQELVLEQASGQAYGVTARAGASSRSVNFTGRGTTDGELVSPETVAALTAAEDSASFGRSLSILSTAEVRVPAFVQARLRRALGPQATAPASCSWYRDADSAAAFQMCPPASGRCVDTSIDGANCGECGGTCSGRCLQGRCKPWLEFNPSLAGQDPLADWIHVPPGSVAERSFVFNGYQPGEVAMSVQPASAFGCSIEGAEQATIRELDRLVLRCIRYTRQAAILTIQVRGGTTEGFIETRLSIPAADCASPPAECEGRVGGRSSWSPQKCAWEFSAGGKGREAFEIVSLCMPPGGLKLSFAGTAQTQAEGGDCPNPNANTRYLNDCGSGRNCKDWSCGRVTTELNRVSAGLEGMYGQCNAAIAHEAQQQISFGSNQTASMAFTDPGNQTGTLSLKATVDQATLHGAGCPGPMATRFALQGTAEPGR